MLGSVALKTLTGMVSVTRLGNETVCSILYSLKTKLSGLEALQHNLRTSYQSTTIKKPLSIVEEARGSAPVVILQGTSHWKGSTQNYR